MWDSHGTPWVDSDLSCVTMPPMTMVPPLGTMISLVVISRDVLGGGMFGSGDSRVNFSILILVSSRRYPPSLMWGEMLRVVTASANWLKDDCAMPVPATVVVVTGTWAFRAISAKPLSLVAASGWSRIETRALSSSAWSSAGMLPMRSFMASSVTPGVGIGVTENAPLAGSGAIVDRPNDVPPPPMNRPFGLSRYLSS